MKDILQKILDKAPDLKIAVIGDFIEDRYVIGDVHRVSPEAPVPVVSVTNFKSNPGGAGNVFMNLRGLGVDARIFCDIKEHNPDLPEFHRWFYNKYPHCVKTRVMADNQHIVRYDEDVVPVYRGHKNMDWWDSFNAMILDLDCVIISDYHKGVVSDDVAERIINICEQYNVPVIVDAKRDFARFERATILKCNRREWDSSGYTPSKFIHKFDVPNVVITEGSNGILAFNATLSTRGDGHKAPIADTCGAGDTVTAVLAVCKALNLEIVMAASGVANRLAAEACKHPGVYPIQREDLIKIIDGEKVRESSV